jgi:hypothetical protein
LPRWTISEEKLFRRQYLMLTPEEEETPVTALSLLGPSRDVSPYEGARLSVKDPARCARSFRSSRRPLLLAVLGGYPFALIAVHIETGGHGKLGPYGIQRSPEVECPCALQAAGKRRSPEANFTSQST